MSINAAVLGFNWRRQRTIGDEISLLKKTLPKFEGSSLSKAIEKAKMAEIVDMSLVNQYESAIPIAQQVESLTKERKELSQQKNREKHYNRASLVAFLGTSFAIIVGIRSTILYFLIFWIIRYTFRDHSIHIHVQANCFLDLIYTQVQA